MAADPAPPTSAAQLIGDEVRLDRFAGIRIKRLTAAFVSVGYLAYGVVAIPLIASSAAVMSLWWTVFACVTVFVPGLALGLLGWRSTDRRLRTLAAAAVGGYFVAVGTWYFGWDGHEVNSTTGIWFSMFFGVAGLAATMAFNAPVSFATLGILATASTVINHQVRPPALNHSVVPDIAWGIGFSLVFVAAGVMVVRTADFLDSTRAQAYSAVADAAATSGRAAAREHFDALTHDSVMATLLLTARDGESAELAQHARTALSAIDRAAAPASDVPVGIDQAHNRIQAAVDLIDPSIATVSDYRVDEPVDVPESVVAALSAAAAEAVRNSRHHAGSDATVNVTVTAGDSAVRVVVTDDGPGFEPSAVPASRFGISGSIRGRMERLPGGRAAVQSAPGAGTTVELGWHR